MSCWRDVMKPIDASSCCTPQDTAAQAAQAMRASDIRVEEIMRPKSACCGADESVEEGRRRLHEHRASSLPVVNRTGGCCGTVSSHDLETSSGAGR